MIERRRNAAFAGSNTRNDALEQEEREAARKAAAMRAERRDAVLDSAIKRMQQTRVDPDEARAVMIAERRDACTPTVTAPQVSDEVRRELAGEARLERLRRDAVLSNALREQATRNVRQF